MPQPASPCPDEEVLVAFSEGRLAAPAQNQTIQHLGGCDACLAAVGSVDHSQPTVQISQRPITAFQPRDLVAGRYEIQRFVARGGMGEVYEAEDKLLGVRVALKTVLLANGEDPRAVQQIRREVQIARAINHPGVCRVFDLGEHILAAGPTREAKRFFLTMEFLDGSTLGQRIRAGGALDQDILLPIARQLADALVAAHEAGVVHRDLKSDNVMLMPATQGGVPRAVIMDFGLARGGPNAAGLSSAGGIMVGSAAYMAPEQVEGGPVREAADIYAFGVVLFEIATGRLPFQAPTAVAMATKRLFEPPPTPRSVLATVDVQLEKIILHCLARRVEDRFGSMKGVRTALAALEQQPMPVESNSEPVKKPRVAWLPWVLAAGGIAAGGTLGFLKLDISKARTAAPAVTHVETPAAARPAAPPVAPAAVAKPARATTAAGPAPAAPGAAPPPIPTRTQRAQLQKKRAARGKQAVGPGGDAGPPPAETAAAATATTAAAPTPPAATAPAAAAPATKPAETDSPSQSPLDGFANPFK